MKQVYLQQIRSINTYILAVQCSNKLWEERRKKGGHRTQKTFYRIHKQKIKFMSTSVAKTQDATTKGMHVNLKRKKKINKQAK